MPVLSFWSNYRSTNGRLTRRQWLAVGGLGSLASLANRNAAAGPAAVGPGFGRAKSVILIYASGGQSQLDMWDPKPQAPAHVRGEFRAATTSVPGVAFTEHMPRIARIANRLTIVRCMGHEDLDHGTASYLALTGRYHQLRSANPPPRPTDFPTLGAVLRRSRRRSPFLYDAIHLNGPALVPREAAPGQNGGFLGREFEPLVVGDVRETAEVFPGLTPRHQLPPSRLAIRHDLKQSLDRLTGPLAEHPQAVDLERLYGRAYQFLSSPKSRAAFDLAAEPQRLRDRYGRNRSGQACLLARRLVEAGVPLVNVIWNHSNRGQDDAPADTDLYGWDTHNDIFPALRNHLLPRFDLGFSALIEDLDNRGLLDETLVICMGEFGRAPLVAPEPRFAGSGPGRKHWASVYSIVMAGAGVGRGKVVGRSDRLGGEPDGDRYGPWDVAATMYWALGIDPHSHFTDLVDRPFPLAEGKPIHAVYE